MLRNASSITGALEHSPEQVIKKDDIIEVTEDDFQELMSTNLFVEPNREDIEKFKKKKSALRNFLIEKGDAKQIQGERTQSRKLDLNKLKNANILLIRYAGIGDILYTFPVAQYIRSLETTVRIFISGHKPYLGLINCTRQVEHAFVYHEKADLSQFDQVLSFRGAVEVNPKAEKMHMADVYFDWIGIDSSKIPDEQKKPILIPSKRAKDTADRIWRQWQLEKHLVIGFGLRASARIRSWLPEYNKQLGLALARRGIKVILLDALTDLEFGGKNIISYCGKLDIEELVGVISKCSLVISPDTGIAHIAGGLDIPIVGIFAAFEPKFRLAYYKNAVWTQGKRECAPCFLHGSERCKNTSLGEYPPCMREITVKDVYQLVRDQIKKLYNVDISLKQDAAQQ